MEIELYCTKHGEIPVKTFLDSLDPKTRAKTVMVIQLLEEYGNALREPYSKYLENGLFELRIQQSSQITRIIYFFFRGDKAILTNGFIKKTQKTPGAEIRKTVLYRQDYLKRKEKGDE